MELWDLYDLLSSDVNIILVDYFTQREFGRYNNVYSIDKKYNYYIVDSIQPEWDNRCLRVIITENVADIY